MGGGVGPTQQNVMRADLMPGIDSGTGRYGLVLAFPERTPCHRAGLDNRPFIAAGQPGAAADRLTRLDPIEDVAEGSPTPVVGNRVEGIHWCRGVVDCCPQRGNAREAPME